MRANWLRSQWLCLSGWTMKADQQYPSYLTFCSWRNIPWTEHNSAPYKALVHWKGRGADGWGGLRVFEISLSGQMYEMDKDNLWEDYIASRND